MKIQIINGPNLNLLGIREKDIYGDQKFTDYLKKLKIKFSEINIEYFQSNIEGELIDKIHEVGFEYDGIIINAAAYSHTSVAILDALNSFDGYVIEVHISDISKREDFRTFSYVSLRANHIIMGKGLEGYIEAIEKIQQEA